MPRVVVLSDDAGSHSVGVNLKVETAARAVVAAVTLVFDVVVEQGEVALVVVEASVVLPANVGRHAIAEILELVFLAAKGPDGVAGLTVDELDGEEMAARDKIVTVRGLGEFGSQNHCV